MVSQLFTSDMPTATQINTVFSVFITVPLFFVFGKDSNRSLLFNFRLTDKNDAIQNSQELLVCKRLKKQNKKHQREPKGAHGSLCPIIPLQDNPAVITSCYAPNLRVFIFCKLQLECSAVRWLSKYF